MGKNFLLKSYIKYLALVGLLIVLIQNSTGWSESYLIKEISVILALIYGARYAEIKKIKFILPELVTFTVILAIGVLLSNRFDFAVIASIRQFAIPFIFVLIGYIFSNNNGNVRTIILTFINTIVAISFFGFFERFIYLWEVLDVSSFFLEKNIPVYAFGYPNFWIEPVVLEGFTKYAEGTPRMVSTIMDPINLGHTIVVALILAIYDKNINFQRSKKILISLILIFALILTLSKGAFLQFGICILMLSRASPIAKLLVGFIFAIPLSFYITEHAGFRVHFLGFINVFNHLSLFGSGFGSFGNVSILYNENSILDVGDSYWAAIIGQLGILGFFSWLMMWMLINSKIKSEKPLSALLISQVLVSALSENSFNFMSISFLMIIIGLSVSKTFNNKGLLSK